MSRQLKSLKIYPLTNQVVQIVGNQEDWVDELNINKVLIRTPDHFPLDKSTAIHMCQRDGYGYITEVTTSDPLEVVSSGWSGLTLDGYDGLVVSGDGYTRARGIIKETSETSVKIVAPAYCSILNHHYLLGGHEIDGDGYTNAVWHSTTGATWERMHIPTWTARGGASAVSDGSNIWIVGGWTTEGSPCKDIWRGVIDLDSGAIVWDNSAIAEDINFLSDYYKLAIIPDAQKVYMGAGYIDLSDGSETELINQNDAYGTTIHYDVLRKMLWWSDGSHREEYLIANDGTDIDVTGNHHYAYAHNQSGSAQSWSVAHGLNSFEVAPVCYTTGSELLVPHDVWWNDENNMTITFNQPVAGRAMVCLAKYYSGSTWDLTDGYLDGNSGWLVVDTSGDVVEPDTTPSSTQMTWDVATDGYLIGWQPYNGVNDLTGRRYVSSFTGSAGDNSTSMYQITDNPLMWMRDGSDPADLVEPASYDYSANAAVANFNQAPGALKWCSMDLRHDDSRDNQEPYSSASVVNLGYNDDDAQTVYLLNDDKVWASDDAGVHWTEKTGTGVVFPNEPVPVWAADNMVAGFDEDYSLARSLTAGNSFTLDSDVFALQNIVWYGALGPAIDTTYKLFIYERPSDVVWESEYGFLPGVIEDEFTTHYVLPYPTTIDTANTQAVSITLDSAYSRSVTANEFADDWIYLFTKLTGAIVDRKEIISNTAGAAGAQITLYCKELNTTPDSDHTVQIIKRRPEGSVYYTSLTRDTVNDHTIHHESDGTAFIESQERAYDYYAHMTTQNGLPAVIATDNNKERINALHAELNRQRVLSGLSYNDPHTLPPELLQRLGQQLGVDVDESLDTLTQRKIISLWHERVDAYGPCSDGVYNLIDLVFGANSGISVTANDPSSDTLAGKTVTISLSGYAEHKFNYASATNTIAYDTSNGWGMVIDDDVVVADIGNLVHSYLVHFRGSTVDGPYLITAHTFSATNTNVNVFFDTADIATMPVADSASVIGIYSAPRQRKIFKFINYLKKLLPHWVRIKFS